jgi:glycosyltransferase involved in cell wall biosynthesis
MSTSLARFSIILPCFNEASRIATSLALVDQWFAGNAEVLVLDDGSSDDTASRAEAFASTHANVRMHRLTSHGGKGKAIRTAIPLARCEYVLILDADLAYDRESIQRALDALATTDIVIGNRRHAGSRYSVPVNLFGFLYRRHLVGLAFNALVRTLLQLRQRDTQCGLKGFRREALVRLAALLTVDGFAIDVEMLVGARTLDLKLTEIPVSVTYYSAKSSVNLIRSGLSMALQVFRIAFRRALGRYSPARAEAFAAKSRPKPPTQSEKESTR